MKRWLKRIRGAFGTALTWAAAWVSVGAIIGLVTAVISPAGSLSGFAVWIGIVALFGFVGGAFFSTVLGITEGRRRFDEMSLPRFAAWGAVGGLVLSVFLVTVAGYSVPVGALIASVMTFLVAGSAAGSLALARRADDRELLEHGADVADIGLTEQEKRELLTG